MAEIYVTTDALQDAATRLTNAQAEQENVLRTMEGVVADILSSWEGKAKAAFSAAWDAKKGTYQEFGIDMSQFSNFLRSYAQTMEDGDNPPTLNGGGRLYTGI